MVYYRELKKLNYFLVLLIIDFFYTTFLFSKKKKFNLPQFDSSQYQLSQIKVQRLLSNDLKHKVTVH